MKISDQLQQKILKEYNHGYMANRSKNQLFESQKDVYAVKKDNEQLRSQIFWSVMRTVQATCIINEPDVTWENENVLFEMEARNFTDMYKSDFIKQNWDFDRYIWLEDICKYWKSVQLFTGWNDKDMVPIVERIDPRFVYPYNDWTLLVKDYPFFGFDRIVTEQELKDMKVANAEKRDWIMRNYDEYIESLKVTDARYRDINTFFMSETWHYKIHYHYTHIDGELRLVLMLWSNILDIYDVPETNNKRIPIAVTWFAYEGSDWRGTSLIDIIEDSHRTEQLMLNLFKIRAVREATGWNIFIDEEAFLKNKESFKNQSLKNRWYPIKMRDFTKPISSMIYELPQQPIAGDIYNMLDMVKNKAMSESFVSSLGQWLWLSENSEPTTATASKIQKINANMMTTLQNQILAYGSEDFATVYRDFMLYYWKSSKKKVIRRVLQGLSWTYKKLSKKDISGNMNVVLVDPIQQSIMFEDKKRALMEQYNFLVNDPNTPPFLLNNIRKSIAYYNWLDESEIDSVVELLDEEYQCKQDVLLLNENIEIYIPPTANPQMRLRYYNKAEDTEAKFKAIEAIKYMITNRLGQQEMNTAIQPKVWWLWQQTWPQPGWLEGLWLWLQEETLNVNGMQDITQ